ncbi:MAG: methyltransferase domain-containing protein [bacterium]
MKNRLVLDAGSGFRPFPYADVLCDLYVKVENVDKPFVYCDIQFLPFKTGIFSFVYCSHVLEHVNNPNLTLSELKRVARHGYASFPSFFWELWFSRGRSKHKWIIRKNGTKIPIKKFKTLKWILNFFWARNWRIRLRKRLFLPLLRLVSEHVIKW